MSAEPVHRPTEVDRFVAQRDGRDLALRFEQKDQIFSEAHLSCTHTAFESTCQQCARSSSVSVASDQQADVENNIYRTLLSSQLLGTENAHCLQSGALNSGQEEQYRGVQDKDRLRSRYNALSFNSAERPNVVREEMRSANQSTSSSEKDRQMPMVVPSAPADENARE